MPALTTAGNPVFNANLFEHLVQHVTEYAIFMLDQAGRVTSWNKGAKRLKGYEEAEIVGQHFSIFYTSEDSATGLPERALKHAAEFGHYETEGFRLRKDGSSFWAAVTITTMRDENGDIFGFSKITRDQSEKNREENRLRVAEEKFRGLLEAAPDAIIIVRDQGRIVLLNKQAETIFGYEREELIGQPVEVLLPERFRAVHVRHRAEYVIDSPHLRTMGTGLDLFGRRKDGSEFPVDISLSPLQTEEGVFITAAVRDVTDRRALENKEKELMEQEKRSRLLAEAAIKTRDSLLAMVSHDLKNPLASIGLGLDLLRRLGSLGSKGETVFERIMRSKNQMEKMIADLLDSHKVEGGRFDLGGERTLSTAKSIIEKAVSSQQLLGEQKNIRMEMNVSDQLPMVCVEGDRLQQVFQNLLGNALKFTQNGGVICISAQLVHPHILFSVADNGPGIGEELLPHVFERFSQDVKTAKLGTGLGLSIVKAIVEAHHGKVSVESKAGSGTTFFFTLPIA